MKRKFTFLIAAAFMLLTMMATTGEMWGQTRGTEVTYDFSEIPGFAQWSSSYSEHVVEYDDATVTFASANKNTQTITDIPVTKGQPVSLVLNETEGYQITEVTFVCRQWGTKTQTITLHYSTDGGSTYTSTGVTSTNFTITKSSLAEGTNAVKITFSSTSNQVGIESCTYTFESTGGGGGDDPTINANNVNIAFNTTSGSIGYTLENATGNVTASITGGNAGNWLTLGTVTASEVPFTCSANTGAQRTATITLSFTGAQNKVVTVTQGAAPMTIAAAREQGTGSVVTRGVVTSCVGTTGYIQDNTAAICVYGASLTVGDDIVVSGSLSTFNGLLEITSPQVTVLSQNNTVTPTVKTIAEINSDYGTNTLQGMLVKIENATVTIISGQNTTISQTISNTTSTIIVRGISGVEYAVNDVFTELTGNIGAYNAAQIANPTNVVVQHDPTITTDATNNSLAVPNYVYGTADPEYETLTVNGSYLTTDISLNLNANSDFEMSTDLTNWSSSLTLTQTSGSVTDEEVAVRMKAGLAKGNHSGTITLTSTGATTVTLSLSGTVTGATYTIEQYTSPANAHGTITFAPTSPIEDGTEVTLTATPAEGYDFIANSWVFYKESGQDIVVDNSITVTNNKITMPAYNLWVDATFTEKTKYSITTEVTPDNSGTIATDNEAWEGKEVTVLVQAADGYAFSALTVTKTGDANTTVEVSGSLASGFAFTMPAYAVTVTATFVVQLNVTYDFTDPENFFTDNTYQTHPTAGTGSSHTDVTTIYYDNASHDQFTASGASAHYFQSGGYFMLESGSMLTLPTFENYVVTQVILHSSSNHSTSLTVSIVSGENTVADAQTWSTTNTNYTYDIPEAYQASALSVNVTNKNGQFTSITLVRAIPSTDPNIVASNVTVAYGETSGAINYTIQNPVSGNSVTASSSTEWIGSEFTYDENSVTFAITAQNNTATDRQGTITLTYGNNLATKEVTITQEHIVVEAPEFNPAGGSYTEAQDVAISCTTAGATIYYTLDSTTPDNTSTAYTGTINVSTTTTIKAIAYVGEVASEVAEATYTFVEPFTPTIYTRASSITSGKHYIIVGFDNTNHNNAYAMGEQRTNNRGAVIISEDGTNASVINEDVYDFVISYVETENETDYYSIYDAENGYLYAANSGKNWLMSENEVTNNSKWAIEIDATSGVASVVAGLSANRNVMQFNYASNNQLFSCYSTANQKPVYLYEKSTTVTPITNNTTVASTDFSADVPAGYRLIASPVNMLNPKAIDGMLAGNYDLYYFDENGMDDEELKEWRNYKAGNFLLESGKGYLYANENGVTLSFIGAPYAGNGEIELNYTDGNRLAGWNLIGNPYGTTATLSQAYYRLNAEGSALKAETESTSIDVMEGVFVKATAANQSVTFTATAKSRNTIDVAQTNIMITSTNGSVIDNTIIRFDGGSTLEKFSLREGSTKVYIKQENVDYAIVNSDANGTIPINFKAEKTGNYTISFNNKNIDFDYLHLIDKLTGANIDLLIESSYSFIASVRDPEARFQLVFNSSNSNPDNDIFAYQNGNEIIVNGEGELQIFDVMGRFVMSRTINGDASINTAAFNTGVYVFRIVGTEVKTQKIVVR